MNYEHPPNAVVTPKEGDDASFAVNTPEVIVAKAREEETTPRSASQEELAELKFSPEPERTIDVVADSASISRQLERMAQLIAREEQELASVRLELETPQSEKKTEKPRMKEEPSPRLAQLKEAKAELEGQREQLGVAKEWQNGLDFLHTVDAAEIQSLMKTGLRKNGERLRGRNRMFDKLEAMRLASLASQGVRQLTWGKFGELFAELMQVADTVLKGTLSPLKRILGFRR